MAKKIIQFKYPATVFVSKLISVDESVLKELLGNNKIATEYIYEKVMSEEERNWTEKKSLESAYQQGYATIKIARNDE